VSRIAACLQDLATRGRRAVVPYIVAGDPAPQITVNVMHALVEAGVDMIELGVPFSDPMAEGPVIQLAHERALAHNVSLRDTLAMVTEFRRDNTHTPVVLMGYANPVEHMGYEAFAQAAAKAGVDGLLTVDMPPEEAAPLTAALKAAGLDSIFLLAPTTTDARIEKVAALASGFLYCVSLKGVTGAGHLDIGAVEALMQRIRSHTQLPIMVGFGIQDAATAAAVARVADGVIVGSALVRRMAERAAEHGPNHATEAVDLIAGMRAAIDALES
jgi:tryptophan synthase alpha chain